MKIEAYPGNNSPSPPIQVQSVKTASSINIYQLLDHLISSNEMDLYYYLMNEVAVVSCNSEHLDISSTGSNKSYNIRIENILAKLIGSGVKIRLIDTQEPSLKSSMIDSFKNSNQWKILESNFPGTKILDMVHKNGI